MANEIYFPKAGIALNDIEIIAGDSRRDLSTISYAEVVTRRYPVRWRDFIETYTLLFILFAVTWAIASSLGWMDLAGPLLALWILFIIIVAARGQIKHSYRHTLTLETTSGTVEVTTSEDGNALLQACEAINERIRHNPPPPVLQQTGEPTRWMQAK